MTVKAKNYRIALKDVRKFKVYTSELLLFDRNDDHFLSYLFQRSKPTSFLRALDTQRLLKQSLNSPDIYFYKDPDLEKLQKSFAELNIEEIKTSKNPHRSLVSHGYEFLSKLASVPVQHVLGRERGNVSKSSSLYEIATEPIIDDITKDSNLIDLSNTEKQDNVKSLVDILPPRGSFKRDIPLSEKQWKEFQTEDGRISDPERIKEIIFRGGIDPQIRAELWKYLLNYDLWDNTTVEKIERRRNLEEEYFRMKTQWTTLSKIQEKNFSGYRDRKCQIEKDVKRTDRHLDFFNGDDNPNVDRLQDILLTYVMFNFDVGYVQGMSDLLSPILILIDDEAASFWCFVAFMEKVFRNFDEDQAGMKNQLGMLRNLMEFSNPSLFKYFKEHDSDNMYFCFRWLLVWFKREFNSDDILQLWECLWTSLPCINFHLLVGIAILDNEMQCFIENEYGFTEILKVSSIEPLQDVFILMSLLSIPQHVNDLSERMDLKQILETAESIYYQIKYATNLNDKIRLIIGEELLNKPIDPYDSDDDDVKGKAENLLTKSEEEEFEKKLEKNCEDGMNLGYF